MSAPGRLDEAGDSVATFAAMPLKDARRFLLHGLSGFQSEHVIALTVFCAFHGLLLATSPRTGGAPDSLAAYVGGFVAALVQFTPPLLAVSITARFAPTRFGLRAAVLGLAAGLGVVLGRSAATWHDPILGYLLGHYGAPIPVLIMTELGVAIYLLLEREQAAEQRLHEEMEHQLNLERRVAEAQLQVLQSQIEPHFLFNTLAHVRPLYETNSNAGRSMLRHLSRYLSASQPVLRESGIPLGQDLELAIAYLNIQQIRMGSRLRVEIDIPAELREALVPPMTLTTLVENAIKHGLSPLPEGGVVRVGALRSRDMLVINVADTGQGFQSTMGVGVGLANVRARLALLHGTAARLLLSGNAPRGVTATITMPMPPASAG